MQTSSLPFRAAMAIAMSSTLFFSCSKGDGGTTPAADCSTLTLALQQTSSSDACSATGALTATGAGGEALTYKIDNDAFQSANTFTGIAAGDHTVTVKSSSCSKSATIKITLVDPGPLYAAVKTMMTANCVSCHGSSSPSGGKDWTVDCNIISNKDRIKARAVDGNPSFMPQGGQLTQENKDKITAWIAAGGKYSD